MGLYDRSDQDLDQYLQDLLYGSRTTGFSSPHAWLQESPDGSPAAYPQLDQEPSYQGGVTGNIGPVGASLGFQKDPGGATQLSPGLSLGGGPLSLNAGLDIRREGDRSTVSPRVGAGVNLPIGGGDLSTSLSLTPQQLQLLAQYRRELDRQSEFALMLQHSRPNEGRPPDTRFGVAYRRRF